ncbi:MAG TPA: hypothetical protein PKA63_03620 [Oligoflexia bacterium]|nr:hypothetical protein [Oligoflexia bacterium]HMP47743.1 hypothetical protein [Oligoflexia bacterium]
MAKSILRLVIYFGGFVLFIPVLFSACSLESLSGNDSSNSADFKKNMRSAYQASSRLFQIVWNPAHFMDSSSQDEVALLLDNLANDFHRVEKSSIVKDTKDSIWNEPGFEIALQAQSALLSDIRDRYKEGNKEYAWWKLKGITHNCVACHSRFGSNTDFIGVSVEATDTSFDARFAAYEFLVATRQFSKADRGLLSLAESVASLDAGSSFSLQALRLWLMVQVRVHETYHGAAASLSKIKDSGKWSGEQHALISRWIVDLQTLQASKSLETRDRVDYARSLLGDIETSRTIDLDDLELVKSARAGAVLHQEAQSISSSSSSSENEHRADILLLLGVSYQRNTMPSFRALSPLYFEQCIREFPRTPQARIAYSLFERDFTIEHTGSGGPHIQEDEIEKLNSLKSLL